MKGRATGGERGEPRVSAWPGRLLVVMLALSLPLAGGASAWRSWTQSSPPSVEGPGAFPQPARSGRAVLWAVGDGAGGGDAARALVAQIAASRFDRLLYLGDVYGRGGASHFIRNYAPTYGRLAAKTWPTPGNHDWPLHTQGYDLYWAQVTGGRPPPWYSVRLAGWQVLSLNSEAPLGPGSQQGHWLRRQLHRAGTCRVAFWHRPRYSAGKHGDQEDVAPLWDALRGRTVIVVNGHDHDMQRFRPIDGITELVAGAGGKSLYELDQDDHRLAFASDNAYGALRLELRPGSARFAFVGLGGEVLDSGAIRCHS